LLTVDQLAELLNAHLVKIGVIIKDPIGNCQHAQVITVVIMEILKKNVQIIVAVMVHATPKLVNAVVNLHTQETIVHKKFLKNAQIVAVEMVHAIPTLVNAVVNLHTQETIVHKKFLKNAQVVAVEMVHAIPTLENVAAKLVSQVVIVKHQLLRVVIQTVKIKELELHVIAGLKQDIVKNPM